MREPHSTPLRRRVLVAIVGIAAPAVALFAIPLALSVERLYHDETAGALGRDATWIAAAIPDHVMSGPPASLSLPRGVPSGLRVGVYTTKGDLLFGEGPRRSDIAVHSRDGRVHEEVEDGYMAVSAPIPSDEVRGGVVRVAAPYDQISERVHESWLLMAGLAVIVIGLAAAFALRQSRRLAAPLEHLTRAAQGLGAGDFSIRAPRSDVREADVAGLALESTARRLGEVLDRERAFSADVSHQLRTRLTGMLLGLESALARPGAQHEDAIRTALARGEQLQTVIEDLVRLTRESDAERCLDVRALLQEIRGAWYGGLAAQGRSLALSLPDELPPVAASPAALRQILQVLLDNAVAHGAGEITVDVADLGNGVAIEVADQGAGVPEGADVFARRSGDAEGHGIGLALARSLAEAEGGRLVLRRAAPPVFSLLLPTPGPD
ncbi:sensor histidine kinase [Sphaerisporangium corydalis]|uniref:histidine kinase n=1 Tax=Sphaerisporangium corydalis TaxID=1441875 RepID=A0ABV9EPD3_9ACTN|nr:HAMP domain-containing sensor histidine kinase [Sphaerisporangium corydalis]